MPGTTKQHDGLNRLPISAVAAAIIVGLILYALAQVYGPEAHSLVFGAPIERHDEVSAADQRRAVSDCLRDRKWRERQFIKEHGEVEIPVAAVWSFIADEEAAIELWKQRQSPVGFERLRAGRVDSERLSDLISKDGNRFGAEVFPGRLYLFTVDRTRQTVVDAETLVSASGFLTGPHGATGDWSLTVNTTSGDAIGTIDASDSWISIRVGIEDSSLTVFAEIDQCERLQRLR